MTEGHEVDFLWPRERLVAEVDGPHHRHEPQRSIDAARDARLQLAGYVVLRIDAGTPDLGLVEGALRALR